MAMIVVPVATMTVVAATVDGGRCVPPARRRRWVAADLHAETPAGCRLVCIVSHGQRRQLEPEAAVHADDACAESVGRREAAVASHVLLYAVVVLR